MADSKKNDYELIYNKSQLTRKVLIPMNVIGDNIMTLIKNKLEKDICGKCSIEGFIQPDSIENITYSSGVLNKSNVQFQVVFECGVICPVEGMLISCVVENITKAGIKAKIKGEISPLVVFIARDHNYNNTKFNNIKEQEEILVRVIGQRFELNDTYISVIAELVDKPKMELIVEKKEKKKRTTKPKLKLKE
jgi:DNA-directed RNA polymerase subunit E'/Rpb7